MSTREEIVSGYYDQIDEDGRLQKNRHGQLEYDTTMTYIHRYADKRSKVLEVGAGTGRYSIALAKEGMDVTAVELVESNLRVLREKSAGVEHISAFQGDATDLGRFADGLFDVTLVFGPMYHLYEADEIDRAIDEAIRVTKPGGVLFFAFISVFGIMYANYFYGNWAIISQRQVLTVCWSRSKSARISPCQTRNLRLSRSGIWRFPRNGSCWAAQATSCISAESAMKRKAKKNRIKRKARPCDLGRAFL